MGEKEMERRLCQRFNVPGTTASYVKIGLFGRRKKVVEEFCPVLDMSRGGIRFLTQKLLNFKSRIEINVSVPGERAPLTLIGRVVWASFNPGKSYRYQAGIKFTPYGEEKNLNNPDFLSRIIALERRSSAS